LNDRVLSILTPRLRTLVASLTLTHWRSSVPGEPSARCWELPPPPSPIPRKSFLTMPLQFVLGRLGPLLKPGTSQYSAWCVMRRWSIRIVWPSQRSLLPLLSLNLFLSFTKYLSVSVCFVLWCTGVSYVTARCLVLCPLLHMSMIVIKNIIIIIGIIIIIIRTRHYSTCIIGSWIKLETSLPCLKFIARQRFQIFISSDALFKALRLTVLVQAYRNGNISLWQCRNTVKHV